MAQESCNLDKDEAEVIKTSAPSSPPPPSTSSSPPVAPSLLATHSQEFTSKRPGTPEPQSSGALAAAEANRPVIRLVNRCLRCHKKVGLTAFRCRCGHLFCPRHRYSDYHDCSFDYKAAGRAEISKNNPLIRAAKIIKI